MRLKLLWTIMRHKWYVLYAGIRLGVSLKRLLKHDLSKLSRAEFGPYARFRYGDRDDRQSSRAWAEAWWHHYFNNDHHWEYWLSRDPKLRGIPTGGNLPMSVDAAREMVADWLAAGKVYEGKWPDLNDFTWFKKRRHEMQMHPLSWARLFIEIDKAAKLKW
jgi:hypothetical protein